MSHLKDKFNHHNPSHYIGLKYEETKDMDIKYIAKLIRKELQYKVVSKRFPQGKYSVKIDRFRAGESIDIDVTLPDTSTVRKREQNLINDINDIINQYNYYSGDARVDYWESKFFQHVTIWYQKELFTK